MATAAASRLVLNVTSRYDNTSVWHRTGHAGSCFHQEAVSKPDESVSEPITLPARDDQQAYGAPGT